MAQLDLRIIEVGRSEKTLFSGIDHVNTLDGLFRQFDLDKFALDNEAGPSREQEIALPRYDVVILNASADETLAMLERLRRHEVYRLALIYSHNDRHPAAQALGDGPPPNSVAAIERAWQQWHERLNLFNRGRPPQGLDATLLAYLWVRAPGKLHAVRAAGSSQHYRYPLIDAMSQVPINAQVWVQNQVQQNLLESTALVDRIRLCRQCGSGHINYVDVCVECNSLDIHRQPSLHCFTCGHIGAQVQFLKDGALLCPNCLTRLRHIGSDYDRPLENYSCNHCYAFFVDADVEARCLDCNTHQTADELLVREIRHYQLSETGLLAARQGLDQSTDTYFGRLAMVGINTFKTLLDWQIELIHRHQAPSFALLGLRFHNLGRTLERLGQQRGHALLDSLIERIQEAIRDTDRCTRTSEEHLWLLLMHTDAAGLRLVTQRLNKVSELFVGQDLQDVELHTVGCVAPGDLIEDEDAALLLARLGGAL